MKIIITVSCIVFLSISALVFAHGGATGVVKERMDSMEDLKDAMKRLKPIMRGQKDYDVDSVKQSALVIRDNAGEHMTKLFPEGSLKKPSEATPEIWTEWEEFKRLANNLERLGQALDNAANNDQSLGSQNVEEGSGKIGNQASVRGNMHSLDKMSDEHLATMPATGLFRMIGQNCKECHKNFRVEK
jgi:cytochrome c556